MCLLNFYATPHKSDDGEHQYNICDAINKYSMPFEAAEIEATYTTIYVLCPVEIRPTDTSLRQKPSEVSASGFMPYPSLQ